VEKEFANGGAWIPRPSAAFFFAAGVVQLLSHRQAILSPMLYTEVPDCLSGTL
jgi:hypothetical protein